MNDLGAEMSFEVFEYLGLEELARVMAAFVRAAPLACEQAALTVRDRLLQWLRVNAEPALSTTMRQLWGEGVPSGALHDVASRAAAVYITLRNRQRLAKILARPGLLERYLEWSATKVYPVSAEQEVVNRLVPRTQLSPTDRHSMDVGIRCAVARDAEPQRRAEVSEAYVRVWEAAVAVRLSEIQHLLNPFEPVYVGETPDLEILFGISEMARMAFYRRRCVSSGAAAVHIALRSGETPDLEILIGVEAQCRERP